MEEKESVQKVRERGSRTGSHPKRYSFEERLRAVRLHLQEGFPAALVAQETGVSTSSLGTWLRAYRQNGETGLKGQRAPRPGRRLPGPVVAKILELKRANRWYGVQRIADALRRWFFLEASAETVRRTLHAADLMDPPAKARRNMTRPRFFERASPNQMWQSDLFTFRLGGKYAYVVAFMDDYSRYIVNLELYRSPTGAAVIETYRVAVGEYSPPKEMLTDRGPQYMNWRGKSRFAVELTKDRVAHLVSRPQHPMTLGKIERFWASMWQEFLVRAQFDSFESARERLKLWVKYYNHRRPHQGIGGLCPADRFFEIQGEVKKTIQEGIQENLLEMALRGKPKEPFYLVGRMEGQSVVLKAEKGKLKLSLDEKELTYELEKGSEGNGGETKKAEVAGPGAHGGGEGAGGAGGVDGAGEAPGSDAGDGGELRDPPAVAGPGDGGDAAGIGVAGEPGGRGGALPPAAGAPAEAPAAGGPGETPLPAGAVAGDCTGGPQRVEWIDHGLESNGADPRRDDREGAGGALDCASSGQRLGRVAEDVLRVGEEGAAGDAGTVGGPGAGPAPVGPVPGGAGLGEAGAGPGGETGRGPADGGNPGGAPIDGAERR